MARQAIVTRTLLLMAVDAKTHRVIDHPLGHRHLGQIPMAGRTIHLRPDMGSVVKPDVILRDKSIHALPGKILTLLRRRTDHLNPRILLIADIFMAAHAHIDTRNPGPRPLHHARMAGIAGDADIVGMDLVREIDRLDGFRPDAQKIFRGGFKAGMRGREGRRTPPLRHIRIARPRRVSRHLRLLHAAEHDSDNR